jgi:hypothetical protein
MSSGKYKRHDGFNPMQIRDGFIVVLRKNGSVKLWKDRKTKEIVKRDV